MKTKLLCCLLSPIEHPCSRCRQETCEGHQAWTLEKVKVLTGTVDHWTRVCQNCFQLDEFPYCQPFERSFRKKFK